MHEVPEDARQPPWVAKLSGPDGVLWHIRLGPHDGARSRWDFSATRMDGPTPPPPRPKITCLRTFVCMICSEYGLDASDVPDILPKPDPSSPKAGGELSSRNLVQYVEQLTEAEKITFATTEIDSLSSAEPSLLGSDAFLSPPSVVGADEPPRTPPRYPTPPAATPSPLLLGKPSLAPTSTSVLARANTLPRHAPGANGTTVIDRGAIADEPGMMSRVEEIVYTTKAEKERIHAMIKITSVWRHYWARTRKRMYVRAVHKKASAAARTQKWIAGRSYHGGRPTADEQREEAPLDPNDYGRNAIEHEAKGEINAHKASKKKTPDVFTQLSLAIMTRGYKYPLLVGTLCLPKQTRLFDDVFVDKVTGSKGTVRLTPTAKISDGHHHLLKVRFPPLA